MIINNAQYTDADNENINANVDGRPMSIPVCLGNRHYDEIVRQVKAGILVIAPYVAS